MFLRFRWLWILVGAIATGVFLIARALWLAPDSDRIRQLEAERRRIEGNIATLQQKLDEQQATRRTCVDGGQVRRLRLPDGGLQFCRCDCDDICTCY
jgi:hypothetical protein